MDEFTNTQLEAMRIVKNDLEYIDNNWGDRIDDDSLKHNSGNFSLMKGAIIKSPRVVKYKNIYSSTN